MTEQELNAKFEAATSMEDVYAIGAELGVTPAQIDAIANTDELGEADLDAVSGGVGGGILLEIVLKTALTTVFLVGVTHVVKRIASGR